MRRHFRLAAALALAAVVARSDDGPKYRPGDPVWVYATHVGPVANPSETYSYYVLPFCRPPDGVAASVAARVAESFSGDRHVPTPFGFRFMQDQEKVVVCEQLLTEDDINRLAKAIEEEWYSELYVNDLPMWVYIGQGESEDFLLGHTTKSKHWLYTHVEFTLGYNGDRIVTANATADPLYRVEVAMRNPTARAVWGLHESRLRRGGDSHGHSHLATAAGDKPETIRVKFSYSVHFVAVDTSYDDRMTVYERSSFLPAIQRIHWLSIINSLVLVMLLTVLLASILLRIVSSDVARYQRTADNEEAAEEEKGWKLIRGDVFRPPPALSCFSAFVGAGMHLFVVTFMLLTLAVLGTFSLARRGSIVATCIMLYVLTAGVGSYVSARLYKQMRGTHWAWNAMLSVMVVPAPLTAFAVLNTTATVKSSTAALPVDTIMVVLALFAFIGLPLAVLGGSTGHHAREIEPPCRVSNVALRIRSAPFYRSTTAQCLMAGALPFSAVGIELHYIFACVWGHGVYTLYGILFLSFCLLTIVTSFVTIAFTYLHLSAEDYRWWWRAFLSGGSIGLYMYAHCCFYYFNHSEMRGALQAAFYFLYMANVAFGLFLMMGAIGFYSAYFFVRYIYSVIKSD